MSDTPSAMPCPMFSSRGVRIARFEPKPVTGPDGEQAGFAYEVTLTLDNAQSERLAVMSVSLIGASPAMEPAPPEEVVGPMLDLCIAALQVARATAAATSEMEISPGTSPPEFKTAGL